MQKNRENISARQGGQRTIEQDPDDADERRKESSGDQRPSAGR